MVRKEKDLQYLNFNRITIGDFEVESTTADLEEMKEILSSLIEKHKDFCDSRKNKFTFENEGMFG